MHYLLLYPAYHIDIRTFKPRMVAKFLRLINV